MTKAAELAKMGEVITNSQIGGRRNIVINGIHKISQRGTANVTGLGDGDEGYPLTDRWRHTVGAGAGRYTASQEAITDLPGFTTCLKIACTTADTSIAASERFILEQRIEGQDLQQLKKGTSDAEKVTVSFYVKGHDSATYTVGLYDTDGRQVGATFSVTTSWARQTVTFPGDTTGVLANDNTAQLHLRFFLHGGSNYTSGTFATAWESATNANQISSSANSIFESDSATFFITGVQLEVGSQATPFEHRSFGEELALCQRYCIDLNPASGGQSTAPYIMQGSVYNSTLVIAHVSLPHEMRVAPTLILTSDAGNFSVVEVSTVRACTGFGINGMTNSGGGINWTCSGGGLTGGNAALVYVETNLRCIMDSEL